MITDENIEHIVQTLAETGLSIPKDVLVDHFNKNDDDSEMQVTRQGKKQLEDSTLFFRKTENGSYICTEIKEKNFNFLANLILDTEMDASVIPKLREGMIKGESEIKIESNKTVLDEPTLSELKFSYFPKNQFYYWDHYHYQILGLNSLDPAGARQKVFIDTEKWTNNYTPTEMSKLLHGGTIKKELVSKKGDFYTTERTFDFSKIDKHDNYEKVKPATNVNQASVIHTNQSSDQPRATLDQKNDSSKKNELKDETRLPRRKSRGRKY